MVYCNGKNIEIAREKAVKMLCKLNTHMRNS